MTDSKLALFNPTTVAIPTESEWRTMGQMAEQLLPTGFLPSAIKTPAQAVAVMMKSRELQIPPMYGLSNIAIINGKPVVSAETMLALIHRDHGHKAIRVKDSTNTKCTVQYRTPGWDDVNSYTFTIEDAAAAGLTSKNPVWKSYPAAMLRARCISAVARMAFPECIAGMYVPGELGDNVQVNEDGEITHVNDDGVIETTVTVQEPTPIDERKQAAKALWETAKGYGWNAAMLDEFAQFVIETTMKEATTAQIGDVQTQLDALDEGKRVAVADGLPVADVMKDGE